MSDTAGTPMRVLLVDDQDLVRAGFRMILSVEPGIEVVGEASNGERAVELAQALRPDVVLMDVQMPGWTVSPPLSGSSPRTPARWSS
jgi:DNA-binding NarL/FixJ family response regulator